MALVDTGAAVSVMDAKLCSSLRKVRTPIAGLSLRTASAQNIQPSAACTARVVIQGTIYAVEFVVLPCCSHAVILGWDFLSRHAAIIDCARAEVEFSHLPEAVLDTAPPGACVKALVAEDIDLPPCSSVLVPLSCGPLRDDTVLFTPSPIFLHRKCLPLPYAVLTISAGLSVLFVSNPFSFPNALRLGECLGTVQPFASLLIREETDDAPHLSIAALSPPTAAPDPSSTEAFLRSIDDNLPAPQRAQLLTLLNQFRSSFDSHQSSLGQTSTVTHAIDTGDHAPLRQRPYRVSVAERQVIEDQVDKMLQSGVIQPQAAHGRRLWCSSKRRMAPYASV